MRKRAAARVIPATLAALVVLTGAAAARGGDPVPRAAVGITLTASDARITAGTQFTDTDIVEPGDDARLDARYDAATGEISEGDLTFPAYTTHVSTPIEADVTFRLDEAKAITGTFDAPTGRLELRVRTKAEVTALGATCTVTTTPLNLTLSTDGEGAPFADGLTGAGALAAAWTNASASPLDLGGILVCGQVNGEVQGPGSVWMEQEDGGGTIDPEPEPGPGPGADPDPGAQPPTPAAPPAATPRRKCPKKKQRKRGRCVKKGLKKGPKKQRGGASASPRLA